MVSTGSDLFLKTPTCQYRYLYDLKAEHETLQWICSLPENFYSSLDIWSPEAADRPISTWIYKIIPCLLITAHWLKMWFSVPPYWPYYTCGWIKKKWQSKGKTGPVRQPWCKEVQNYWWGLGLAWGSDCNYIPFWNKLEGFLENKETQLCCSKIV